MLSFVLGPVRVNVDGPVVEWVDCDVYSKTLKGYGNSETKDNVENMRKEKKTV